MRKIYIGLIMMLMLSSSAWAYMTPGTVNDELVVGGTGTAGEKVTFVLLDADTLGTYFDDDEETIEKTVEKYFSNIDSGVGMSTGEIFYFRTVDVQSGGKWEFVVPMHGVTRKNLVMLSNVQSSECLNYASVSYRKNIIPVLKQKAALNDGFEELENAISENIRFVSGNYKAYAGVTGKRNIARLAAEKIRAVDENSESALSDVKAIVDKATLIEQIAENKAIDFDEITSLTEIDDSLISSINSDGKAAVLKDMLGKSYESFSDYDEKLIFSVCFNGFYNNTNKTGDKLAEYLSANNTILELDLDEFVNLSETNRARAASELAALKALSKGKMQSDLDEIITVINKLGSGSGGSGGGGGGTSSGSAYNASAPDSISNENIEGQKNIYSDMADVPWAADAIVYLTKNKIVNGYDGNLFKPLQAVTRAEFTKIVVCAFLGTVPDGSEGLFKDASADEWYTPYLETAYKNGIVSGDESGFFKPDDLISRQDMAVIIYNAARKFGLLDDVVSEQLFADDESISDYAKTAVYCLRKHSVINGVGDGMYLPLECADRASAAKIIYSLMMKNNG